jgi:hypothetical protein
MPTPICARVGVGARRWKSAPGSSPGLSFRAPAEGLTTAGLCIRQPVVRNRARGEFLGRACHERRRREPLRPTWHPDHSVRGDAGAEHDRRDYESREGRCAASDCPVGVTGSRHGRLFVLDRPDAKPEALRARCSRSPAPSKTSTIGLASISGKRPPRPSWVVYAARARSLEPRSRLADMRHEAMSQDFGWRASAATYANVYRAAIWKRRMVIDHGLSLAITRHICGSLNAELR